MKTLPLFPEKEFQIGEVWVTKLQLQTTIKKLYPDIVEGAMIHSTFNIATGSIDRKFAWNAVYNEINRKGLAASVINALVEETLSDAAD